MSYVGPNSMRQRSELSQEVFYDHVGQRTAELPTFKDRSQKNGSLEPKMFGAARRVLAGRIDSTRASQF